MLLTTTKYRFKNKEFNSLKDVQNFVHDIIGKEVLDKINKNCDIRHKDLIKMFDILCSKEVREILKECYNVTYSLTDEDTYETIEHNILDL